MTTFAIHAQQIVADPDLDLTLGNDIGNEILLRAAAETKTKKVPGSGRRVQGQSGESRAWTMGGRVD